MTTPKTKTASKAAGRPSSYSDDVADEICALLVEGQSLAEICRRPDMPGYGTIFGWLKANDVFAENYARAREAQGDTDADNIGDISRRVLSGEIEPNAARVAIDALKWTAGKRKPKVYGDRQTIDMNVNYAELSDEELLARASGLLKSVGGTD